jgi:Sugar kinases, ribokinase family
MQYLCRKNFQMDKIIGLGNALVDVLATLKDDSILHEMGLPKGSMQLIDETKLQQINDRFSQMKTHLATGGSAGNAILGLASLGAGTGFIGKVGNDKFGDFYRENLLKNNIEEKLLTGDMPSGVASTFISPDGERTFGTYLGAAASLKAEDLTLDLFQGYSYLFIEGYLVQDHEMILHAIKLAKEAGLQICLDLASYNVVENDLEFFTLLIDEYVDIVFANEEEAKSFTGKEPEEALNIIAKKCSIAIVKIGAKGSYIKKGTEEVHAKAILVNNVVDTTGAGDFFAAGFLYGLTCGYGLEKCANIGSVLSGNVIQVVGTNLPKQQWDEIKLNINTIISQ